MNNATITNRIKASRQVSSDPNSGFSQVHRKTLIGCILVLLTVIAIMFIYVYPIRAYYATSKKQQTEQRKLDILKKANADMRKERSKLSTDGEIERIAREQYHLVKPGEEAYIVTGK
jgi:cell division protein FtsL